MERYGILSKLSLVLFFISCFTSYGSDQGAAVPSDKIISDEFYSSKLAVPSSIESVVLVEFYGTYDGGNNITEIVWSIESGSGSYKFGVERSTDNVLFTEVGEAKAGVSSGAIVTYSLFDQFPTAGTNYYRLKHVNIDGSFFYVGTMTVEVAVEGDKGKGKVKGPNKITLFSNPVYESEFTIALGEAPESDTELFISDVWGNRVATVSVAAGTKELTINSPERKGNYLIEIMVNGELLSKRVNIK